MKTIGLLGGMSWESTVEYYRAINKGINVALGGLHSAKIAMLSVDFDHIEKLQHKKDWKGTAQILADAAKSIQVAGADFIVICTNTMHKVVPEIETEIDIPILHIVDATAEELVKNEIKTVGLLGTAFTMEQDFYKGRLNEKYGLNVLVPCEKDRRLVHQVIYEELCLGIINQESKSEYLRIIDALIKQGAEAIILGCTEIGMLLNQRDTSVRLFDTAKIHAAKAIHFALQD
ncbi:MAG: aspartate racemase [Epsilonproteobacteria bacterium]|nr:MAG: aspartate racemase [Campylobacterota bacterium]RLA67931.1 MAG: aspartate racemase [Campylobacterota bacterium]